MRSLPGPARYLCAPGVDLAAFFVERQVRTEVWRTAWIEGSSPEGPLVRQRGGWRPLSNRATSRVQTLSVAGEVVGVGVVGAATADDLRRRGELVDPMATGLLLRPPTPVRRRSRNAGSGVAVRAGWLEVGASAPRCRENRDEV